MIGIVASRLVERYHRPVVLIAGPRRRKGQASWKGSGRSVPAFDLHAGLAACSDLLERFGGHRAAAGLSIRPEAVDGLAEAFAAHADEQLATDDLRAGDGRRRDRARLGAHARRSARSSAGSRRSGWATRA